MASTSKRFRSMDALRGLAILGIFLINIIGMGGSLRGEEYPPLLGWTGLDRLAWWVQSLFVEGTMRGLLSLLFGASFILFLNKLDADPDQPPLNTLIVYYRRAFWLVVFGLIHAYVLLWPGDILFIYGLAAFALYPLRDWPARRLIGTGLIFIFVLAALMGAASTFGEAPPPQTLQAHAARFQAALTAERQARLGGYLDNARYLIPLATEWNLTPLVIWWVADALAMMLIGAGLAKRNILQGRARWQTYALMAVVGYGIGLSLRVWLSQQVTAAGFVMGPVAITPAYQISRCATTIGHVGLFLLVWTQAARHPDGTRRFEPLVWVGRMALTNYIGQTIIGQFLLFSGFGLGLFGRYGWAGLTVLAIAIWPVQMTLSGLYLHYFRTGPLEWAWRWLTRVPWVRR
ncbi:DUF418 domain-containing protein [Pedomonas mirosovicensis]|uniref:DUF418 domain-containing protein n=1 Tax=Pedomonas mirosovicensis TaxID=2908641 RepID=UPI002168ED66|nr:DUF418 domain-containing protein [Pedomonas mirosovicensis]MCH8685935.1 DUF418 domain-containing protein [Pedomonas mirosovicensis]